MKIIAIYRGLKVPQNHAPNSCDTSGSTNSNDCWKIIYYYIIGNIMNIVECLLCPIYFPKFTNIISFYPYNCQVHTVILITFYIRELL